MKLTPEMEQRFQGLRAEFQKAMVRQRAEIDLAGIDMRELMDAEEPDKSAIGRKMKEVSDLQHEQQLAGLDHRFAVREMLTPEQREIWKNHHRGRGVGRQGEGRHESWNQ